MGMGSSNKAQQQAQQEEAARQAAISNTIAAVTNAYKSPQRAKDIADYVGAVRTYLGNDLDRQKALNDRQLRFALARNGQLGGSTQIDQQRRLGEDYSRGLLTVEQKAKGAGADLAAQDQDAQQRLISLASSGLDATTAATQAAEAMRSSLGSAQAGMAAQGLGDIFGNLSDVYKTSQEASVRRRADKMAYNNYYQPSAASSFWYGGK